MLVSGAVAGAVSWLSCYPVDVVKSVVQTGGKGEGKVGEVVRELWGRGGWRSFFRGLSPTLIRSVPVNAVTFVVYEHSQLAWEKVWPT
jgi:solute carrier family 25 carnitine/acylcarnitine transporter 20/29